MLTVRPDSDAAESEASSETANTQPSFIDFESPLSRWLLHSFCERGYAGANPASIQTGEPTCRVRNTVRTAWAARGKRPIRTSRVNSRRKPSPLYGAHCRHWLCGFGRAQSTQSGSPHLCANCPKADICGQHYG